MIYWILGVLVGLVLLRFAWLLVKRCALIRKIRRCGEITWKRNRLASVFRPNGRVDCTVKTEEREVAVSILTTPFRRVRYHFISDTCMQIILGRRGMYLVNAKSRDANVASVDNVVEFVKYRLDLLGAPEGMEHYLLVHPAPRELSVAKGATMVALSNNDELYPGIKICGGTYLIQQVLSKPST